MSDKKAIILAAASLGFFRSKDAEKQAVILEELAALEEYENVSRETLGEVLEAEILRRHVVYQQRAARKVTKDLAEAEKPLTGGTDSATDHVNSLPPGKYLLTMAQNNTDVDKVFLNALQNYAKHNDCRILVGKVTYNKNGFQQSQEATDGIYYDPLIAAYTVEGQVSLGGQVDFIGQANVMPTAKNPLSGFEGITAVGVGVVIPSSKIALKCTAALAGGNGKILFGTGAITKRNYIVRKAGAVAATEHNIGALFIDTTVTPYIARQLEMMPGSTGFYDENMLYDGSVIDILHNQYPIALQFGDIHAEKMLHENMQKMIDLIRHYRPGNIVIHDLMDFSSRNHHNVKDCAFMFKQHVQQNTVKDDIGAVAQVLENLGFGTDAVFHIVESNHDLAINTWLKNADFKEDPTNAVVYLKCMTALYEHIESGISTDFNMLKYALQNIAGIDSLVDIIYHGTDESVIIAGIEMGCHGHTGTNGSRGSPAQFRALGIPMNTGHTHTPSILGGCYTAGVSATLEMGYNIGASSWKLAHILTYPNGQRQVIFM